MVVSDQAFSAEAEKCLQGLERHLGVSGCLLRREPCRHCACALHPHLRAHVEKLGRIQRRCSTSRVAVASSQGEKDFGFFIFLDWTHHGGRLTARVSPGFLVGARHGADQIDLGHRASPPELRRCVGNSVDHGQRWACPPRTMPLEPETSWRRSPERLEQWNG